VIVRAATLVILSAVFACDHSRRPPVTKPPDSQLTCELKVRELGARLGLAFALTNRSPGPRTLHYVHPFLQFELRVTADGRALTLTQPDINIPSQPRELSIAAGATAELDTPVTLRFAPDAADAGPLVWTIESAPTTIELHATLRIEGETIEPCGARVERR
jgi:hypothetical protein